DLYAASLSHTIDAVGYRLAEPDGRRMLPERLAGLGIARPPITTPQRGGSILANRRTLTRQGVREPPPGARIAFVMDTRLCDNVYALAVGADMLVIESTYLDSEQDMAREWGHLTAGQAAQVAQRCGVRTLVLTHFSQRYPDSAAFGDEAARHFD